MQLPYRATRWLTPSKDETIVRNRAEAEALIQHIEKILLVKGPKKLDKSQRAHNLSARAGLYAAIGSPKMLEAAQDALAFCRCSNTYALKAMSLHHFGRIQEANEYYEKSYKEPHEPGWEVDLSYAQALMSQGRFLEAWPIVRTLKKRLVYAGYLKEWDGKPCDQIQIISEGGFGDIAQNIRFLPQLAKFADLTTFLPPFFFEHGFTDLLKRQPWCPPIKLLTEAVQHVPSVGFFDLPAALNVTSETIPPSPLWLHEPKDFGLPKNKPIIGLCWAARAQEVPICPPNVYRAISEDKADAIVQTTKNFVNWISLQKDEARPDMISIPLDSWETTASLISNLDLVVSVDTATAHVAACMQKPTWVLVGGPRDWKWGLTGDTKTPWYPTMTIFGNDDFGFDRAIKNLVQSLVQNILVSQEAMNG